MRDFTIGNVDVTGYDLVIFDIDGTLKDLCAEHTTALESVIQSERFNSNGCGAGLRLVSIINGIAMQIVKIGIFPTNYRKQSFLISLYAVLLGVNIRYFKNQYSYLYGNEVIVFKSSCKICRKVSKEKEIQFVTINDQNFNLENYGIEQSKISYVRSNSKLAAYRKAIEKTNIPKDKILIIGDNLPDDMLSARKLGIDHILVNNYHSRIKNIFCSIINKDKRRD